MCGFVGIVAPGSSVDCSEALIRRGLAKIRHRGPDNLSAWSSEDSTCSLGHVRLSIIAPTEQANQPMKSRDGRFVLVFNGEIYNYRQLYRSHLSSSVEVDGSSDTSVLLHLLMRLDKDAISLLDGMFAFAFYDTLEQSVLVARDRMGEKPVYYSSDSSTLWFSSELAGLRAIKPQSSWALDDESIALFQMEGCVAAPRTIFADAKALPSGSWFRWRRGESIEPASYWELGASPTGVRFDQQEIAEKLSNAVSSRLVSDVPVGIFLSGGIDSSSIVSTAVANSGNISAALCIDFPEEEFSEAAVAQEVAGRFGIPFHRCTIDKSNFERRLPDFFASMDQPTIDGFNTYFISQAARDVGLKVWLSGVGGDELFGGYPSFHRMSRLQKLSRAAQTLLPQSLARRLSKPMSSNRAGRLLHLAVAGDRALRAYQVCRTAVLPGLCEQLLVSTEGSADRYQYLLDGIAPAMKPTLDSYQQASVLESTLYMGAQLLRDIDNFSMSESIEIRAPFLDHQLAEYVWGLSQESKVDATMLKPLLVAAVPGGLPPEVPLTAKRGFTFPMTEWLRKGMESEFRDVVLDSSNSQIWNLNVIERLWNDYTKGKVTWHLLWTFFVLANWRGAHKC